QPSPVASEEYNAAIRAKRELLRQRDLRRTRARVRRPRRHDRPASRPNAAQEPGETPAHDHGGKDHGHIALTPATCTPTRLLDQRLEVGDAPLQLAIPPGLGPTRRCGNGHGDSPIRMEL